MNTAVKLSLKDVQSSYLRLVWVYNTWIAGNCLNISYHSSYVAFLQPQTVV